MPLILARHIPDVENVRIIKIYRHYKLSNTVTSYTVHVGTSEQTVERIICIQCQNADSDIPQNWFWILNNCYKFSSKGLEA